MKSATIEPTKRQLHIEEQLILTFLKQEKPMLSEPFLQAVQKGRDGILSRLISSLLRENIMNHKERAVFVPAAEAAGMLQPRLSRIAKKRQLFKHAASLCVLSFETIDAKLLVPVGSMSSFFRPVLCPPFILVKEEMDHVVLHPNEILDLLLSDGYDGPRGHFDSFRNDVANSAANLALAYASHSLSSGISTLEAAENALDSYSFFEQLVIEGHPTHPGAKMRKGLSPEENWNYSAEFKETVRLQFAAVSKNLVYHQQMPGVSWQDELLQAEPLLAVEAQKVLGHNWKERYTLFPVHPWQAQHILPSLYKHELERGELILLPYTSPYVPGMSFRTLFPSLGGLSKPHYKLPASVHLTGEIRTLSEQTIHNGPLMSELVHSFVQEDTVIDSDRFVPVMEKMGAYFLSNGDENEAYQTERSESLSFVIRENIAHHVREDEWGMVCSALVSRVHDAPAPLIAELITRYKLSQRLSKDEDAVFLFLIRYVKNMLSGTIPLMTKYGIGVEGHLQNSVAVFSKDGTPLRLLMRDWEGIRVHRGRLSRQGVDLDRFHHKSRILVDDLKSVYNKVFYSVVQNHFAEIILTVSAHYRIEEKHLWSLVRDVMMEMFEAIGKEPLYAEDAAKDAAVFFAEKVDYKAVTLMRMTGEAHSYFYSKVDNPLSHSKEY
ncbi:IucA/IucC family protein [Fictibacillus iocasae]|uniref:IucA/IucC family protein n=1 Tax=Fictibacillus iocasae TaxID=2715437 RepID=A0ABW2NTW5_9BACL